MAEANRCESTSRRSFHQVVQKMDKLISIHEDSRSPCCQKSHTKRSTLLYKPTEFLCGFVQRSKPNTSRMKLLENAFRRGFGYRFPSERVLRCHAFLMTIDQKHNRLVELRVVDFC